MPDSPSMTAISITYRRDRDDEGSLCDNYVLALFVDSGGRLWVATSEGVLERLER